MLQSCNNYIGHKDNSAYAVICHILYIEKKGVGMLKRNFLIVITSGIISFALAADDDSLHSHRTQYRTYETVCTLLHVKHIAKKPAGSFSKIPMKILLHILELVPLMHSECNGCKQVVSKSWKPHIRYRTPEEISSGDLDNGPSTPGNPVINVVLRTPQFSFEVMNKRNEKIEQELERHDIIFPTWHIIPSTAILTLDSQILYNIVQTRTKWIDQTQSFKVDNPRREPLLYRRRSVIAPSREDHDTMPSKDLLHKLRNIVLEFQNTKKADSALPEDSWQARIKEQQIAFYEEMHRESSSSIPTKPSLLQRLAIQRIKQSEANKRGYIWDSCEWEWDGTYRLF
jgi:hypothetical protein